MGNGHIIIVDAGSHPLFAGAIAHYVDVELMKPEMVTFSNGNHMATVPKNVRGADVFVIQTQAPPVDTHIVQLMLILDALKSASAAQITAVLPYMPYVRSDKKDRPRISIAARLMARQIELVR
jgi:ribose-phosphate pyrophosphokinase